MTEQIFPTNREGLFHSLRTFQANGYQPETGRKASEYLPAMIHFLGDPDPELRDELIYSTLAKWITESDFLDSTDLHWLLAKCLEDDHLFYKVGNNGDTSVFTRTFTALVIALLLYRHRQQPFLSLNEINLTKSALLTYLAQEKDWRGYTIENGWAHAAAHSADALDELAQCREIAASDQLQILKALQNVLWNGRTSFSDEEDERLATLVCSIIHSAKLPEKDIITWLHGLQTCLDLPRGREQNIARINSKNLCRCLYFRTLGLKNVSRSALNQEFLNISQLLNKFL